MATKRSLRSSEDIYHRLRWDPALPAERVVIGYEDRLVGDREIPMLEFTPGGRIPWSRVWYFRLDSERIWDRRIRLDRLFGSGNTRPEQILSRLQQHRALGEGISVRPVYRYDPGAGRWAAHAGSADTLPSALTLLTLNVLFDDYEQARIDSPRRYAAIASLLSRRRPDLIVLQEVQPPMLSGLLSQDWARGYFATDIPTEGDTLRPYGQVLLSRWAPSRLLQLRLSHSKRILIATFETGGTPIEVAALHLTSDRRPDAAERRAAQVERLAAALSPDADHVLVGDFNFGDDQEILLLSERYADVWPALRPGEPGYTYDPAGNPLAALFSQRGIGRRLDRVFLRAPPERLVASSIEIVANTPLPDATPVLLPSDHYGLSVALSLGAAREALSVSPTTHHAALAVVPPEDAWGPIQAVRRALDPSFARWMPHLNLLYGFVPEGLHAAAAEAIAELVADEPARTLTFSAAQVFQQPGGQTLYLAPDADSAAWLSALQRRLRAVFPQCVEQERDGGFTPHLTVGHLPRGAAVPPEAAALAPLSFSLSHLSLLARTASTPFREAARVSLGGGAIDLAPPRPGRTLAGALRAAGLAPSARHEAARAAVAQAAARIGGAIHVLGSARLGLARPDSDLDVLLIGRTPRAEAWAALEAALGVSGRWVERARVPVLKLAVDGVPVDVLHARYPEALPLAAPEALTAAQRELLAPLDRQAALGCLEADAIRRSVEGREETWGIVARALRGWAAARQLDAQAVGYPGGLAWTILSAAAPRAAAPEAWLEAVFAWLYSHELRQPVGLCGVEEAAQPVQVWSSCAPRINTTAAVIESTRAVLYAEIERALEIVWEIRAGERAWSALLEPVTAAAWPARLLLTVQAPDDAARARGTGWLMGNVLGLLIDLERRVGLPVRPMSQLQGGNTVVIGLPERPEGEQRQRIQACLAELQARFGDAIGQHLSVQLLG